MHLKFSENANEGGWRKDNPRRGPRSVIAIEGEGRVPSRHSPFLPSPLVSASQPRDPYPRLTVSLVDAQTRHPPVSDIPVAFRLTRQVASHAKQLKYSYARPVSVVLQQPEFQKVRLIPMLSRLSKENPIRSADCNVGLLSRAYCLKGGRWDS